MNRTSIVLGILALLLGGYIFFIERGSLSTGELEKRKGSALPELVRDRVERLEIQRKGVTMVLARTLSTKAADDMSAADEEDEAALWRVEAPYQARADQGAVDTLLGELEWLDGRRNLGPVKGEDMKRFGFDKPRIRVAFTVGKVRARLVIGKDSPRGDGVYVMTGNPAQAYLAGKDLPEAFSHEPGHYHHRELHDGLLLTTARRLTIRDAHGERGASKRADGLWAMLAPGDGLASDPIVSELVTALDQLHTQRFVAGNVKDFARYGLQTPRTRIELVKTKFIGEPSAASKAAGAKPAKGEEPEETFTLSIGAPCEGHAGESYVRVASNSDVSCASDADLAKLDKSREQLREARLLPVDEDEVKTIGVQQRGVRLTLSADDAGTWSYAVQGGGVPKLEGKARDGAVSDWLKALSAATATRFDVPPPAELTGAGAIALEVGRGKDKPAFQLKAALTGTDLLVRRADEPQALALAGNAAALLAPQAARFRPLKVLDLSQPSLRAIEVTRGGKHERVTRAERAVSWNVVAPVAVAADNVAADELARMLCGLEAARFDGDVATPAHGLATPAAVVTLELAGTGSAVQRTVIEVGAETEGGRFAQVRGHPGVFVLAGRTANLLLNPLASPNLLSTPLERLHSVAIVRAGKRVEITRTASGFAASAGSTLSAEAARSLAETIATVHAMRALDYGPPAVETGLQRPALTLEIAAEGEGGAIQRHTLALGEDAGEGTRYARRSDVPVVFVLPKGSADRLLAAAP